MVEELNQMAMRIKILEEQAETIQTNLQLIQGTINNFETSLMTLGNLKDAKPDQEVLINIGTSTYLKAKIKDPNSVIVGVGLGFGTDVYVEKSLDAARETLNARIEEVKKAQNTVRDNLNEILQQIQSLRPEFERRYAQFQQNLAQSQGLPHDH
ncbi:MAG: prefoldin subunit alpha [Candidatus Helarchaeota archaeon]